MKINFLEFVWPIKIKKTQNFCFGRTNEVKKAVPKKSLKKQAEKFNFLYIDLILDTIFDIDAISYNFAYNICEIDINYYC